MDPSLGPAPALERASLHAAACATCSAAPQGEVDRLLEPQPGCVVLARGSPIPDILHGGGAHVF